MSGWKCEKHFKPTAWFVSMESRDIQWPSVLEGLVIVTWPQVHLGFNGHQSTLVFDGGFELQPGLKMRDTPNHLGTLWKKKTRDFGHGVPYFSDNHIYRAEFQYFANPKTAAIIAPNTWEWFPKSDWHHSKTEKDVFGDDQSPQEFWCISQFPSWTPWSFHPGEANFASKLANSSRLRRISHCWALGGAAGPVEGGYAMVIGAPRIPGGPRGSQGGPGSHLAIYRTFQVINAVLLGDCGLQAMARLDVHSGIT